MTECPLPFGLTGGIACGKTTVAGYFTQLGAKVIDADAIAHNLLRRPSTVYSEVVRRFGESILGSSGEIDRKRLAETIFSNTEKRRELESILHPRIIEKHDQLAREYLQQIPRSVVLVEAALIYEAKAEGHFRKIIVAWCTPEQQIDRLMAKGGISRADSEARIAAQMPMDAKRGRADFIIDCSTTLDETRRQASVVYRELKRLMDGDARPP
jgi:dephospho-CoA kinase